MTDYEGAAMSAPDVPAETLASGDDSVAILQDTTGRLARPVLIALATSAAAIVVALTLGRLVRILKRSGQPAT